MAIRHPLAYYGVRVICVSFYPKNDDFLFDFLLPFWLQRLGFAVFYGLELSAAMVSSKEAST